MELDAYRKMAETEDEHWWFCGRRAIAETIIAGLDLPEGANIVVERPTVGSVAAGSCAAPPDLGDRRRFWIPLSKSVGR